MTYVEIISNWIEAIIETETGESWEQMDKNGLQVIDVTGIKKIRLELGNMILYMGFRRHAVDNVPFTVSPEGVLIAFPPRPLYIYIPEAAHTLIEKQGENYTLDMKYNVFIREEYYQVFLRDKEQSILSPLDYMHRGFEVSMENPWDAKQRMIDRKPVN